MLQLKIDIVGNDLLTKTFYSESRYQSLDSARDDATTSRNLLFRRKLNGEIRDYIVDIVTVND